MQGCKTDIHRLTHVEDLLDAKVDAVELDEKDTEISVFQDRIFRLQQEVARLSESDPLADLAPASSKS